MKNLIKYLVFLIFLYLLWFFVLGYFSFLLFFMFLSLLVLCLLLSIIPMRKTTITMEIQPHYCLRDENVTVSFYRQSHTPIDCGKIVIDYQIIDAFSKIVTKEHMTLDDQKQDVTIACPHCGHYIIQVNRIKCFDLLQCFSVTKKVSLQKSFDVMPHYYPVDIMLQQVHMYERQKITH